MKHLNKILGIVALIAVIGFSMTACGDDNGGVITVENTSGTINITGIPAEYNSYYVFGKGYDYEDEVFYYVASSISGNGITFGQITNQSVTLKVWRTEVTGTSSVAFRDYSATDDIFLEFFIFDTDSSMSFLEDFSISGEATDRGGRGIITFTDGEANVIFSDLEPNT